jgi:hypothetical protein
MEPALLRMRRHEWRLALGLTKLSMVLRDEALAYGKELRQNFFHGAAVGATRFGR